jgi:peptide deformylase
MTIHPIIRFPDPRLRQKAAEVTTFDESLKTLAADLLETMRSAPGVGITGPHVGVMLRVVVIELGGDVRTYVNPVVEWSSPDLTRIAEGSISMPGVNDEVERPARVRVRFRDLAGVEKVEEADGFRATCLQHEIDQLDGIFWIDRLSRLKRDRLTKRFAKLGRT